MAVKVRTVISVPPGITIPTSPQIFKHLLTHNRTDPPQGKRQAPTAHNYIKCCGDPLYRVQFIAVPSPEIAPTRHRASARPPPHTSHPLAPTTSVEQYRSRSDLFLDMMRCWGHCRGKGRWTGLGGGLALALFALLPLPPQPLLHRLTYHLHSRLPPRLQSHFPLRIQPRIPYRFRACLLYLLIIRLLRQFQHKFNLVCHTHGQMTYDIQCYLTHLF